MKLILVGMIITSLFFGNQKYRQEEYEGAKRNFKKSKAAKSIYNLGNTHYRMGEYADALESWDRVIEGDNTPKLKFSSFYNSGNAYFKQGDLKKAEENYLNALNIRPYDEDARHNLELTRKKMKEEEKKKEDKREEQRRSGKEDKQRQEDSESNTERQEKKEQKTGDDQSEALKEAGAKKKAAEKLSRVEKEYLERLAKAEKRYRGKYLDKIPKTAEDVQKQMMKQMDEEGYFLETRDW